MTRRKATIVALIPPGYLKAVVALGSIHKNEFSHSGTGFLYAHPVSHEDGKTSYRPYLITNKHIVQDSSTHIRFISPRSGSLKVSSIEQLVSGDWVNHSDDADVSAIQLLDAGPLMDGRDVESTELFIGGFGTISDEKKRHLSEGDGVFLLGFPLGLVGVTNFPIVRQGNIARAQDWLSGNEQMFLIDAPAFPGNSGGPVILKPETAAVGGTMRQTHSLLIGIVSSQISYLERAVSERTGRLRVIFEENTGLTNVVPIEKVVETVALADSGP